MIRQDTFDLAPVADIIPQIRAVDYSVEGAAECGYTVAVERTGGCSWITFGIMVISYKLHKLGYNPYNYRLLKHL